MGAVPATGAEGADTSYAPELSAMVRRAQKNWEQRRRTMEQRRLPLDSVRSADGLFVALCRRGGSSRSRRIAFAPAGVGPKRSSRLPPCGTRCAHFHRAKAPAHRRPRKCFSSSAMVVSFVALLSRGFAVSHCKTIETQWERLRHGATWIGDRDLAEVLDLVEYTGRELNPDQRFTNTLSKADGSGRERHYLLNP